MHIVFFFSFQICRFIFVTLLGLRNEFVTLFASTTILFACMTLLLQSLLVYSLSLLLSLVDMIGKSLVCIPL